MTQKSNKMRWLKWFGAIAAVFLAIGIYFSITYYNGYFRPNVTNKESHLYIYSHWNYDDLRRELEEKQILNNTKTFEWAAEKMDFPRRIKPGRYRLEEEMNNRMLINRLGGGLQEPVRIQFQNIRLRAQFAGMLATQLEPDSLSFIALLHDEDLAASYGFTDQNFFTMFIPNTYEFYWNTNAKSFVERMHQEYERFWNEDRLEKAAALQMTPQEVGILASIVDGEALHNSEMPTIAGLYLNRLRKGMLLQADPTVIFAHNDFTIRRVLYRHLELDSPYNTYKTRGLPPGPINMPSITAIDAVLNPEEHAYIYMCAKEDFSGYHRFAVTQAEHNVNARKFQQALNERNIKR